MSRRPRWVGWVVLAAAVLAVVAVFTLRSPGAQEGGKEAVTDVAVHVGKITRAAFHRYVTAYGRVEPEPPAGGRPPARAVVASPVGGILVQVDCMEGGRVTQGTTLFRLDSRVAEIAAVKAQQTLEFAEKTLARQKGLMESDGTSRRALQEAEQQRDAARAELASARTQLALLRITAPVSGTVVRMDARLGQAVETNTVLADIVDLDRLVIAAGVPSREAAALKEGQRVELGPEGSAAGSVSFIGKGVDPRSDTVPVRASLPAKAGFGPGQFLSIRIVTGERRDCLAVPENSLVTRAGEGSWIVVTEGNRAIRKPVTSGLRERGLVEVAGEGLREGMSIVTEDAYSLPPETKIRILGH